MHLINNYLADALSCGNEITREGLKSLHIENALFEARVITRLGIEQALKFLVPVANIRN